MTVAVPALLSIGAVIVGNGQETPEFKNANSRKGVSSVVKLYSVIVKVSRRRLERHFGAFFITPVRLMALSGATALMCSKRMNYSCRRARCAIPTIRIAR